VNIYEEWRISDADGEMRVRGFDKRVVQGMDLGAQAAFAASDGFAGAPFLRAPALC
jgi:hypothetical protein